jgi:hypothetical protein
MRGIVGGQAAAILFPSGSTRRVAEADANYFAIQAPEYSE